MQSISRRITQVFRQQYVKLNFLSAMRIIIFLTFVNLICFSLGAVKFVLPEQRISNGANCNQGCSPWTVGLAIKSFAFNFEPKYCVGALISNQYVLTTASCVDRAVEVKLHLGAYNITDPNEKHLRLRGSEVFTHHNWNPDTLQNNIAIVKLPNPIDFTATIKAVNLPNTDDQNWVNFKLNITGWGDTSISSNYPQTLKLSLATGRNNSLCSELFSSYFDPVFQYCFGGVNNQTICAGDEGAPAIYTYSNRETLVGLASFRLAESCSTNGSKYPGVFTNVFKYNDWIKRYTAV